MGPQEVLAILSVLAILCFGRPLRKLGDGLNEAFNNFRGGPPTPMHPIPVNDGALLRRWCAATAASAIVMATQVNLPFLDRKEGHAVEERHMVRFPSLLGVTECSLHPDPPTRRSYSGY
jgi:hypothetical protein